ncbi:acyltransferase family protein [Streptomyces diastaticus]|uniref:acyltransferase family protein n=1 Tax=Streptomyces diastaticus TaxID=1956 RepID=UPI0035D77313
MRATWLRRAAASVEAATPAHRDRALDGLRALALLAVPAGHWLLGGFTRDSAGGLHNASPLSAFPSLAPLSWVLQMLAVFFLVGGHASALSYRRAAGRGEPARSWVAGRLVRLGRPVLGVTSVWAGLLVVMWWAGVPDATLHTAATLVIQPLWFVGVYGAVTTLTPWCVRASRKAGVWAAAPLLGTVAVVDLLRYGPWSAGMPSWLSLLNLLPGWLFAYQLGVSWGEGRVSRHAARVLLAGGAVLFAVLLWEFGYPISMVGVPGETRTNSHPPSLLVLALASFQSGAAVLLRDRLASLLRRPAWWAPVVAVNLSAMTILCWHQTAMLTAAIPGAVLGVVPGLTSSPDTVAWIAMRVLWMPLFAVLLVVTARSARRLDAPWTGTGRGMRVTVALLAAGFAIFALRLA